MISVQDALMLFGYGAFVMLAGVIAGVIVHNRWIDRKLAPKKPIVVVQQPKQTP